MAEEFGLDNMLKVAEIATIVGSVAVALFTFGGSTRTLQNSLDNQSADIADLKIDIKKLNEIVIAVALQDQRMDMISERLNRLDERWDEIRHGRGYVLPDRPDTRLK